ncbi:hypothetical protein OED52_03500 [Rhodococcus sp. Z13]|uniref:Uncharacterized protein n=1 Tax=Rhodococcus sacchari TaxID=2962047 RepID=A0ACD4DI08_9NOCA|nr:hypothetical protein [Rhodococcus sp. Z13]UYP19642.1 hypothetical protein OED52_03500 [Rhodococcus sp. Z13]
MSRRHLPRSRRVAAVAALGLAAGLALPTAATAEPAPVELPAAPAENPLTAALEALRGVPDADPAALTAAEAIANAHGSLTDVAEDSPLAAYEDGIEFLRTLGIEPFLYPTVAPFCAADGNLPLGVVPAAAGAVPGPWPNLQVAGFDLNAVDPAETLFAFVPLGLDAEADTAGVQLAWFNINTFQGGIVPMGTIGEVAAASVPDIVPEALRPTVQKAIEEFVSGTLPAGGARVAPVETGSGTVLSAIFGNVRNSETSCFFLPTIGIVNVPATEG